MEALSNRRKDWRPPAVIKTSHMQQTRQNLEQEPEAKTRIYTQRPSGAEENLRKKKNTYWRNTHRETDGHNHRTQRPINKRQNHETPNQ